MTLITLRVMPWPRGLAKLAILAAALTLMDVDQVESASVQARSLSLEDVRSAVSSAHDGDIVIVPAGTASWTQTLFVNKSITLRGANSNATDDVTVILDDIVLNKPNNVGRIISATISPKQWFRVTGITFRVGSRTTRPGSGAAIQVNDSPTQTAPCTSLRIDHCHFDRLNQMGIRVIGWFYGVIDHCEWDTATTGNVFAMNISAPTWGGGANQLGNGSWADPSYLGTDKFIFIEDNVFNNNARVVTNGCIDSEQGGRYVCRYNTFKNTWPGQHGTESGGYRGGRAFEIYNNTFNYPTVKLSGNLRRSGSSLIYNNTVTAASFHPHMMNLTVFRESGSSWRVGGASGNNPWDVNDTTDHTNNGFGGGVNGLYASGKHSGGANSTTLVVSDAPWTPNQWAGYSVTNLNQKDPKGFNVCSFVTSNTSTTMSFSNNDTGTQLKFNPGDAWQARRVITALDQPGRGRGDLLGIDKNGKFYNTTTGNAAWPHETLEPVYCWNNKLNGTMNDPAATVHSAYPSVQENRDYYNYNSTFDGTSGIGSGPVSNRPASCTTGVAYWATDKNTLYQCSATNTWTPYYTPYIYPHPLVTGAPTDKPAHVRSRRSRGDGGN